MSNSPPQTITRLLSLAEGGDVDAFHQLWQYVYDELHRVAENQLRAEYAPERLSPTELIHESFPKLVANGNGHFANRREFFAAAARAMREIRVDDARRRGRQKRGGTGRMLPLVDDPAIAAQRPEELIAVREAMDQLAELNPQLADVVNLRYFGGFTVKETAAALEVSPRKVQLDWQLARAWLSRALSDNGD